MSDSSKIPPLMNFPMAQRLALVGWRIRRSVWNAMPTILTNLTNIGNTASLQLTPGQRKLAWLEYRAGLWYISTWQEVPSGATLGEWVKTTTPRVVEADDMTVGDMSAEDWTVYDPGCDLSNQGDCPCALHALISSVPGYPKPQDFTDDSTPFDLFKANVRMGVVGCTVEALDGPCDCGGSSSSSSGGSTEGSKTDDSSLGGGGSSGGDGGGDGGNFIGSGGGNTNGGTNPPPRPRPQPPEVTGYSVDVSLDCSQSACYHLSDYGLTEAGAVALSPPPSFSGVFSLNGPADGGALWFYSISFRGAVIATGLCSVGVGVGFDCGPVPSAQPGQTFGCVVNCSKPHTPLSASGSTTSSVPGWCPPDRSRPPSGPREPTPRRPDERRPSRARNPRRPDDRRSRGPVERRGTPRRPDDRRPGERRPEERRPDARRRDDRRPSRRGPPTYGITVNINGDRSDCYTSAEVEPGVVPLITFSGDFVISAPEGTWSYTLTFRGSSLPGGTCLAGESVTIPAQMIADATPGEHMTVTVHANRVDGEGTADGAALGNVPAECVTCGPNEHPDESGSCVCNTGYHRDGSGNCVADPSCGANEHVDPVSHECVCVDGYHRDGSGSCITDPTCGANMHLDAESHLCVCNDGFVTEGGDCVIVCTAPNEHRDGDSCVCNEGYYRDGGGSCMQSVVCGPNEIPDGFGGCVCADGYYRDGTGSCVPFE